MLAFDLGPTELIILIVLVLVLFGGAQLPKLAKNLGKAQKEFRDSLEEGKGKSTDTTATPAPAQPVQPTQPTSTDLGNG